MDTSHNANATSSNSLSQQPNDGNGGAAVAAVAAASHDFFAYLNNNSAGAATILERESFMQCKHCNRYYKSHQKLQEHVRKYCLKQKKFKCISCEYRSRRKDHVLRHSKRKHSELYARMRNDEESLYEIRPEDDNDDPTRFENDWGGADVDVTVALDAVGPFGFDFGGRDLTITAMPIMPESEDDDDDYDDDGE